jgi:SAM-dependent methyltransferase
MFTFLPLTKPILTKTMENTPKGYHPEPYWSEVAKKIKQRKGQNIMAGDDEPFYRYKRARFLQMLRTLSFTNKKVLELGSGPGGNLIEVYKSGPSQLVGADISSEMIQIAGENVPQDIELVKIDGQKLPFEDRSFDLVFSVTVLQHNSDENMMTNILKEMCRVSNGEVALFERVEKELKGDDLCMGRPIDLYAKICEAQGFKLKSTEHINIRASYLVCGAYRKGLNPPSRKEGDPLSPLSFRLQQISLPFTKLIDKVLASPTDLTKMVFERNPS